MSRFEADATIDRPADAVWEYAADILRHPDWMTVADAHVLRGQGTEVGARGRERLLLGPFKWDVEFEVVAAEPGRRLVWRSVDDPRVDLEVGLALEPIGPNATRAVYHGSVAMRGRWRLLAPLIAMEGSAGVRRELARLKTNVETTTALAAAT
jgi:uncharacterized membrane protein